MSEIEKIFEEYFDDINIKIKKNIVVISVSKNGIVKYVSIPKEKFDKRVLYTVLDYAMQIFVKKFNYLGG